MALAPNKPISTGPSNKGGKFVPFYQEAYDRMPAFQGVTDENGNLLSQYSLNAPGSNIDELLAKLSGINLNTQGLEQLRTRATGTGPSDWAKMMLEGQKIQYGTDLDNLLKSQGAGRASAFGALASRGGVSKGARERIASKSMQDAMMGKQGLSRQNELNRINTLTTDENQKLDLLKALPGLEVAALQPELQKTNLWAQMKGDETKMKYDTDKTNINSLLQNLNAKNTYEMGKYENLMKGYAAERQATATEKAGK